MCLNRGAQLALAALAIAVFPAGGSAATDTAKTTYTGTLDCSESAITKSTLHAPITVVVSGTQATYSRDVSSDTGRGVIGQETGKGAVAGNGDVTLKGEWQSAGRSRVTGQPAWDVQGTYSGNLGPNGGTLTGKQISTVNGQIYDRTCTITLAKPAASATTTPSPAAS
jgi:hypothetical protein